VGRREEESRKGDDVTWEDSRDLFGARFDEETYEANTAETLNNTWQSALQGVGAVARFSSDWSDETFLRDKAKMTPGQLEAQLRSLSERISSAPTAPQAAQSSQVKLDNIIPREVLINVNHDPSTTFPTFTCSDTIFTIAATLKLNDTQLKAVLLLASKIDWALHGSAASSPYVAFKIEQTLRMIVGGAGGSGKSFIIRAVDAYAASRNASHLVLKTSQFGSTASNVGGWTTCSLVAQKKGGTYDLDRHVRSSRSASSSS